MNNLQKLDDTVRDDIIALTEAAKHYGDSWKRRGGVGAFMMLARKWDRLENAVQKQGWDVFALLASDQRAEGAIDDIRDLRRYLLLVETEMRMRGLCKARNAKDAEAALAHDSLERQMAREALVGATTLPARVPRRSETPSDGSDAPPASTLHPA